MIERTLCLIKPDATKRNLIGAILSMIEGKGLTIKALKKLKLTKEQAATFYIVHKERPFYNDLINYMTSGPIVAAILEGENAVKAYRELMGATNPENAEQGTIRKTYALNLEANSVHGSDSPENAAIETAFMFSGLENC
ncbi:nucleoside-diphosphate kinase [Desulfovibrio litoralis]|uniref:Nucleoside diphosphate kinase n=1 Tax=Desulfovibrio litoralis DSM 11393 TaxID=1121455 RepID=A0A1M7S925_9BACT|nr:nucleoside-diphosphate kinase [Desulfovibrio litoralis]SHN54943.1 nucleoside diphosphate kinase [Desulfovibrio litoralis DSM 11393]